MRPFRSIVAEYGHIDLCREWGGQAIGLRDGALLALLDAGVTLSEAARLPVSAIRGGGRTLIVEVRRGEWTCSRRLEDAQAARVIAWLAVIGEWGSDLPLFHDRHKRAVSRRGLSQIAERYRRRSRRSA